MRHERKKNPGTKHLERTASAEHQRVANERSKPTLVARNQMSGQDGERDKMQHASRRQIRFIAHSKHVVDPRRHNAYSQSEMRRRDRYQKRTTNSQRTAIAQLWNR